MYVMQVCEPDDLVAGTCPFVSGPGEVWAAAGAVMSGALRGQDRNYWTEGGWQRELALGANRCCNHKEIHNPWIKYEERGQQEWRMVMTFSLLLGQSPGLLRVWAPLIGQWLLWREAGELCEIMQVSYRGLERCDQKPWKKLLARRQLFGTYCRFIIQKQRVSGRSMLCQSVLKHLRHSSSVMKSVKKGQIWQNVFRTLFYHKCFVSRSFYRVSHSQGITSMSEYLIAGKACFYETRL